MPFDVYTPGDNECPVVVEVPHASLAVDALTLATLCAPAQCIARDADLYVDELYVDATNHGATLLVARTSRYVCDLNRGPDDVDDDTVAGAAKGGCRTAPHGLIWLQSTDGSRILERPIARSEFERRLNQIYHPYHAELRRLLQRKRERHGYVILLAAHSMPSSGRRGHDDPGSRRADIVPGSQGRTTAHASVIDCPDQLARRRGWSVAHDQPYRGGFTTAHHGRPDEGIHVVQVELNRRLYMSEETLEPSPEGFAATRAYCSELVAALCQLPSGPLVPKG